MNRDGVTNRRSNDSEAGDGGFTLVELLIVMMVSGVLVAALATAIAAAIRITPTSDDRIDDARSTRALSTYLSYDTTSTPPFSPELAQGGMDVDTTAGANNNDCAQPGTNIIHMQWTESAPDPISFVANYRFVIDGSTARIQRTVCSAPVGDPYEIDAARTVTPELDPSQVPVVSLARDAAGDVTVVSFTLTGTTGETVLVETTSRNPSDYFP